MILRKQFLQSMPGCSRITVRCNDLKLGNNDNCYSPIRDTTHFLKRDLLFKNQSNTCAVTATKMYLYQQIHQNHDHQHQIYCPAWFGWRPSSFHSSAIRRERLHRSLIETFPQFVANAVALLSLDALESENPCSGHAVATRNSRKQTKEQYAEIESKCIGSRFVTGSAIVFLSQTACSTDTSPSLTSFQLLCRSTNEFSVT